MNCTSFVYFMVFEDGHRRNGGCHYSQPPAMMSGELSLPVLYYRNSIKEPARGAQNLLYLNRACPAYSRGRYILFLFHLIQSGLN